MENDAFAPYILCKNLKPETACQISLCNLYSEDGYNVKRKMPVGLELE